MTAKVKYTKEQREAIESRNADILVSAAAGSGKTAVLVERIISLITDRENPINIDELLCLTFTEPAAREMREKIYRKLSEYIELHPENPEIHHQLKLLRKSHISTIDAFCGQVVKNHYNVVEIDPKYKIIQSGEAKMLMQEVIEKLFEQKYAENNIEFFNLIEFFCQKTTDDELKKTVFAVYDFASSMPYPKKWLNECVENFHISDKAQFQDTVWGKYIINNLQVTLEQIKELLSRCAALVSGEDKATKIANNSIDLIENIQNRVYNEFTGLYAIVCDVKIRNMTNIMIKPLGEDGETAQKIYCVAQDIFEKKVKKFIKDLPMTNWREDICTLYPTVKALVELVIEFSDLYSEAKRENQLAEFNDIAHFALNILIDENGQPTAIAQDYQKQFKEIIIDEYQDCSFLQDVILEAVSSKSIGSPNRFMVGDVKQCIYKFRMANPEIFSDKYNQYSLGENKSEKLISLNKNFRSRKNILDTTNFMFYQFMSRGFGDVDYNEKTALNCGADYPAVDNTDYTKVELAIFDSTEICKNLYDSNGITELSNEYIDILISSDYTSAEKCTYTYIANKIHDLLSDTQFMITDPKTQLRRRPQLSDIVILCRSFGGRVSAYTSLLNKFGIPASSKDSSSLFETAEMAFITDYLKIIDNPLQNTCITAVLYNPIYGINANELVHIQHYGNKYLYENIKSYIKDFEDSTSKKLQRFMNDFTEFTTLSERLTPIGTLLKRIYRKTGYYSYVGVLRSGAQRQKNLDSFLILSENYDRVNNGNIFAFLHYLEQLEAQNVMCEDVDANSNCVRLMTIHASKGLEFPIVFIPQLEKDIIPSGGNATKNKSNIYDKPNHPALKLSQELGMGLKLIEPDINKRTISNTITNFCLDVFNSNQMHSEAMRLLYVAMTRCREKLYMIACPNGTKIYNNWGAYINYNKEKLPVGFMQNAGKYIDWIATALSRSNKQPSLHKCNNALYHNDFINNFQFDCDVTFYNSDNFSNLCNDELFLSVAGINVADKADESSKKQKIVSLFDAMERHIPTDDNVSKGLSWTYSFKNIANLPKKASISDIKHKHYEEMLSELTPVANSTPNIEREFNAPQFDKKKQISGADRGTIYHTFMEHIDFYIRTYDEIDEYKKQIVAKNILSPDEVNCVDNEKIYKFLNSDICRRICNATEVYRETAFTLGLSPYEIYKNEEYRDIDELIHIDGIIDLFFVEENQIVLLDYKTDFIENGDPAFVMKRYSVQLEMYADAITRAVKMPVKEKCLYLFGIDNTVFY